MAKSFPYFLNVDNKSTGKSEKFSLRLFNQASDLEPLAILQTPTDEALVSLKKTIIKGYRRFPWGFFVVEDSKRRLAGTVQLGFFRPWWFTMAMGRQPFPVPVTISKILAALGILDDFEISNIFICPEYRGTGLADELMEFAENFARELWKRKKIILLVNAGNKPALRLYEKRGFRVRGVFRKGAIEKLEMAKQLI